MIIWLHTVVVGKLDMLYENVFLSAIIIINFVIGEVGNKI